MQPLLDLKASPQCPPSLQVQEGRKQVLESKRLTGKHFLTSSVKEGNVLFATRRKLAGKERTQNNPSIAHSVICSSALANVWNCSTLVLNIDY